MRILAPAQGTRLPGSVPGTCFAGSHFPRSPPFAPSAPPPACQPCSRTSSLLWQSLTSHVRASPVTAPRLHGTDHQTLPCWPDLGSPGSRTTSFFTCQVLRPRRADDTLAITHVIVLPSAFATASAPGLYPYAAQWLAGELPYRCFALTLAGDDARLGADATLPGSLLLHRVELPPTTPCRSPGALRKILDTTHNRL